MTSEKQVDVGGAEKPGSTWKRRLLVAAGVVLIGGISVVACASSPVLSVHHASIRSASTAGVGLDVSLRVQNPNSYDVQIRTLRANVTVGRYGLQPLEYSPNQWLQSDKWTTVTAPVVIPWSILPKLLAETVRQSEIPYHIQGSADLTASQTFGLKVNNYPVDEDGQIPRQAVVNSARTVMPTLF
jgi:hypothetical protein